ncbi:MAG: glycosyltransferase family 4 protein [Desulfobacterium sp.]|nr:glycosyltransferase family 4 protein [Desulfobacterium sp.]
MEGLLKLRRLNAEEQRAMGAKVRQNVLDYFSVDIMTKDIIKVYNDILNDCSKPGK